MTKFAAVVGNKSKGRTIFHFSWEHRKHNWTTKPFLKIIMMAHLKLIRTTIWKKKCT